MHAAHLAARKQGLEGRGVLHHGCQVRAHAISDGPAHQSRKVLAAAQHDTGLCAWKRSTRELIQQAQHRLQFNKSCHTSPLILPCFPRMIYTAVWAPSCCPPLTGVVHTRTVREEKAMGRTTPRNTASVPVPDSCVTHSCSGNRWRSCKGGKG